MVLRTLSPIGVPHLRAAMVAILRREAGPPCACQCDAAGPIGWAPRREFCALGGAADGARAQWAGLCRGGR
jgi:hypothetical protein